MFVSCELLNYYDGIDKAIEKPKVIVTSGFGMNDVVIEIEGKYASLNSKDLAKAISVCTE